MICALFALHPSRSLFSFYSNSRAMKNCSAVLGYFLIISRSDAGSAKMHSNFSLPSDALLKFPSTTLGMTFYRHGDVGSHRRAARLSTLSALGDRPKTGPRRRIVRNCRLGAPDRPARFERLQSAIAYKLERECVWAGLYTRMQLTTMKCSVLNPFAQGKRFVYDSAPGERIGAEYCGVCK